MAGPGRAALGRSFLPRLQIRRLLPRRDAGAGPITLHSEGPSTAAQRTPSQREAGTRSVSGTQAPESLGSVFWSVPQLILNLAKTPRMQRSDLASWGFWSTETP